MARRLSEVARKVGVSEATVSRVLNGRPGVSQAKREAVLTALDVLGYERPSQLRGDRGRLVGLVVPELVNPIFPALAEVIGGALAQQQFTPLLCTLSAGGVSEGELVDLLLAQHVSGVVFAGGSYSERGADHRPYRRLAELDLPVVLVNASVEELDFPCVACDDLVAVRQALGHVLSLGHQRVALLLGPEGHVPSERKLEAARQFAAGGALDLSPCRVAHSQYSVEGGQAVAKRLVDAGATALVCASDPLALGAVRAARRAGLEVPGDVSVVGFDDSALMSSTDPALTTVRQPIDAMGRAAIDLLAAMIAGRHVSRDELLIEPELVVRGSTAAARSR
ncbi:LacI family DNA-binding transcriptional regulator [Pseudokineococcus basanitobsidens]|uniref:LacI family DNA-binding transcriptional regulator n=1 Tax=Pseudokineococcus basanitobsidens TaxID=1926649 RepID=A0ABU8RIK2_9ACTN